MRAIEIACPVCAQQPGEACKGTDGMPQRYYHAERITDALSIGHPDARISDEQIERAAEQSGLI